MEETKAGQRHSAKDRKDMQDLHDIAVRQGADCKNIKVGDETFITLGEEIKALGDGKVGGYLVRFTNENKPDLVGDFFTKDTDFGDIETVGVYVHHGQPIKTKDGDIEIKAKIGKAKLTKDNIGVYAEAWLNLREDYEKFVHDMVSRGKASWSSGALSHLVERESKGNSAWLKTWIIGEASVTPTPAEPSNLIMPIKSLIADEVEISNKSETDKTKNIGVNKMEKEELKAMFEEQKSSLIDVVKKEATNAATKAVEDVLEKLPEVKAKLNPEINVVKDEADQPFKNAGEYFMAVKNAAIMPSAIDPRLKGLKATGLSEAQPSQAGFLVPQQTAAGIIEKMYNTGSLLSIFSNRDRVAGNNMTYNVVDETSRANGSRYGGVTGYWMAEGGTKTASKPTFRQLELKLKKVAALCVATDELLEDAPALESWLTRTVPDELRFKVEDSILNGDGVGKPLGIRNSGVVISATRTDANEIDPLDIGRMWAARWAGVNDYVWLGNQGIFPQMLNLSIGNTPVFLNAGGLSGLPYATLLGRPYYDVEYLPALGTAGDLMLISPSQYQMIEKNGIQTASSIHVYFTTDESAFRFVYRVDGAPIWNSTLTGFDGGTYAPFVQLAATT